MTPEQAHRAAVVLLTARRTRSTIEALPADCRPSTVDEGYAVQDALVELSRARVAGWKLGATTRYWQRRAGLSEPMAGRLLEPNVHRGSATLDGASFHLRMIECEYAFRLARDLPPRDAPYSREEVEDACGAVHGCIEVADSRFASGLIVDSPSLIADNMLAAAYVVGPEITSFRDDGVLLHAPIRAFADGVLVAEGAGEHAGGHPIAPLVWLANDRRKRGDGLSAGMLVSTGSCTGVYRAPARVEILADYGAAGVVSLVLS
jgi:2-keto-4-pentenoate hydratase